MRENLLGKTTVIRPLEKADLKTICHWWNNTELMAEVLAEDFSISLQELEEKYWPAWENPAPHGPFIYLICLNQKPIGEINHTLHKKEANLAEIHLKIAEPTLWGKSYGKDALTTYLDYLLKVEHIHRIHAKPGSHNKRMQSLCRKLGFTEIEHVEIKEVMGKKYHDLQEITFELTREKWEKRNPHSF